MIITTTNSIENAKVEKYLGVVTTNLVIGTNVFSDFKASLTDFFGGMSGTYRRQMDTLYQRAYDALAQKATSMGANCVLGFKIDFDELSGKGTQMFMISVSGTAVKIKYTSEISSSFLNEESVISSEKLAIEIFKENWMKRNQEVTPSSEDMNFILSHNLLELVPSLYEYYAMPRGNYFEPRPVDEYFPIILSRMEYERAVEIIYKDYTKRRNIAFRLIRENNLFSAERVIELLKQGEMGLAIELLEVDKSEYTPRDLEVMQSIVSWFNNLPDKGKIEEQKSGILSSKLKEMYICPNGHKNDVNVGFCQGDGGMCGLNIKGLVRKQVEQINTFSEKVHVLKKILNNC